MLKIDLPLVKSVLELLPKRGLIPLRLTTTASVADAGIHKKVLGSGTTTWLISNEEIKSNMKVAKSLDEPDLLIKDATKTS